MSHNFRTLFFGLTLVLTLVGRVQAQDVDDFTTGDYNSFSVQANAGNKVVQGSVAGPGNFVRKYRVEQNNPSGAGNVTFTLARGPKGPFDFVLGHSTDIYTLGRTTITWDGTSDTSKIKYNGLNLNLASAGFARFVIRQNDLVGTLRMTLFDSSSNGSEYAIGSVTVPASFVLTGANPKEVFIELSSLQRTANFSLSRVGAIQLEVYSTFENFDISIDGFSFSCDSNPHGMLKGTITKWPNLNIEPHSTLASGRVENFSNRCDWPIGLASYKIFEEPVRPDRPDIPGQELCAHTPEIPNAPKIAPNSTQTLSVSVPPTCLTSGGPVCNYQLDLFYGPLIRSFRTGERYNERKLAGEPATFPIADGGGGLTLDSCTVVTPTPVPTATRTATRTPTSVPTTPPTKTSVPTVAPTKTTVPTVAPTKTSVPTVAPTKTSVPTVAPTKTTVPTVAPTKTTIPTVAPTRTSVPTVAPTKTSVPTVAPTNTSAPTVAPTKTSAPTVAPTNTTAPTVAPTKTTVPTVAPTRTSAPTVAPTNTSVPTVAPTRTSVPTVAPTKTQVPTVAPTRTSVPTVAPTRTAVPSVTATPSVTIDCAGVPGGSAKFDDCGICNGGNVTKGCDGVCSSNKVNDSCGVCGGNNSAKGCDGVCFSAKKVDVCGNCGGSSTDIKDCTKKETCVRVKATTEILGFEKKLMKTVASLQKRVVADSKRDAKYKCGLNSADSVKEAQSIVNQLSQNATRIFKEGVEVCGDLTKSNCVTVSFAEQVKAEQSTIRKLEKVATNLAESVSKCFDKKKITRENPRGETRDTIGTVRKDLNTLVQNCKATKVCSQALKK